MSRGLGDVYKRQAVHSAKAGHPGGSLSAADIFTYLYFEELNIDPKNPKMADRDRFVLSKGHTAPGLYAVLAERGFFPKEDLVTLRHTGSYLQGHPDMKHIPGIDMSSGSLGQGLSAAAGMAAAGKFDKKDYRVYALCGDGEIQEGQIWEAAMWAGFRKLDNLVVIVDNNNLQIDGTVDEVCSPYPIDKKFEAFNFHTININGGSDKIHYYISGNYMNNPGIMENSGYERYSARVNLDAEVKDWFTIGVNAYGTRGKEELGLLKTESNDNFYTYMQATTPGICYQAPDGRYGGCLLYTSPSPRDTR